MATVLAHKIQNTTWRDPREADRVQQLMLSLSGNIQRLVYERVGISTQQVASSWPLPLQLVCIHAEIACSWQCHDSVPLHASDSCHHLCVPQAMGMLSCQPDVSSAAQCTLAYRYAMFHDMLLLAGEHMRFTVRRESPSACSKTARRVLLPRDPHNPTVSRTDANAPALNAMPLNIPPFRGILNLRSLSCSTCDQIYNM